MPAILNACILGKENSQCKDKKDKQSLKIYNRNKTTRNTSQDYKICSEPKRQSKKALRRRENQHPSSPISTANAKGAWLILCPDTYMIIFIPFHTAVLLSTSASDKIMLAESPADIFCTLHYTTKQSV